jgi:hypothetical protein
MTKSEEEPRMNEKQREWGNIRPRVEKTNTSAGIQYSDPSVRGRRGLFDGLQALTLVVSVLFQSGCATAPTFQVADFRDGQWKVHRGQAVWRPSHKGEELTGELLVAGRSDGRWFIEFTKGPLPMVTVQVNREQWRAEFGDGRVRGGTGAPPARAAWLVLPVCVAGGKAPAGWEWEQRRPGSWRLANPSTGETLEGFLDP